MSSLSSDTPSTFQIWLDNPKYPREKNMDLLLDFLRNHELTPALFLQPRVPNPKARLPLPTDTFDVAGINYALYPHTPGDNPRMTITAQEEFRKDTRAAKEKPWLLIKRPIALS